MTVAGDIINVPVLFGSAYHDRNVGSVNCVPNGAPCEWYSDYSCEYCCPEPCCGHPGMDVACSFEPLYAVTDGVVYFAGPSPYFRPNWVGIRPTIGPYRNENHIYGHMSAVTVSVDQIVRRGQRIGTSGEQDPSSGPHIHWERRTPDSACNAGYRSTDPTPVLTAANANGDGVVPPPDPVPTTAIYGDFIKAIANANVRATPAGAVIGSIGVNGQAELLSETNVVASLSGTSYTWVYVSAIGKNLKGWVATSNFTVARKNRLINPHIQNSGVTGLSSYKGGTFSRAVNAARNLVATGGAATSYTDWWLSVVTDGTGPSQGVYFRSLDINANAGRYTKARGHVSIRNVSSGDSIKYLGIRIIYTDGSKTDKWHPLAVSGTTEQRISIPEFALNTSKSVARAQFYAFGDTSTGNARSWQINRAIVHIY